ncbi:hypothetical protein Misp01_82600 [Microtetraspora sp. NBRC 13810]|uniref:hypothetical protein n=1 Tax=Microtetraspora sp. NBRC 13810 TaxID=3030990 RepID=UPI0024A41342|nr:hypothetical protein [Microtetraspora sp. NBRC 13810]GLW13132.1 hypothetical protein Misp01_82600 [Microtetraspora sp. NBRC 13810]
MEIVVALGFAAAVLFGADRLLLWLERRGHVNWRRTARPDLTAEPSARLDALLADVGSRS